MSADNQIVRLILMWPDGSITCGSNATDVLKQLCGGWNPDSLSELRREFASRCGMSSPDVSETDDSFICRLVASGALRRYDVQDDELNL